MRYLAVAGVAFGYGVFVVGLDALGMHGPLLSLTSLAGGVGLLYLLGANRQS